MFKNTILAGVKKSINYVALISIEYSLFLNQFKNRIW